MDPIHNERVKLLATYLNGIAIALFAVGTLAPIVTNIYGSPANGDRAAVGWVGVICLAASAVMHYIASLIVKRLFRP